MHPDVWEDKTYDNKAYYEVIEIVPQDAVESRFSLLRDHLLNHTHIHYFCFCQTLIKSVPTGLQIVKFHNLTI
jgi:hypothetical protein